MLLRSECNVVNEGCRKRVHTSLAGGRALGPESVITRRQSVAGALMTDKRTYADNDGRSCPILTAMSPSPKLCTNTPMLRMSSTKEALHVI